MFYCFLFFLLSVSGLICRDNCDFNLFFPFWLHLIPPSKDKAKGKKRPKIKQPEKSDNIPIGTGQLSLVKQDLNYKKNFIKIMETFFLNIPMFLQFVFGNNRLNWALMQIYHSGLIRQWYLSSNLSITKQNCSNETYLYQTVGYCCKSSQFWRSTHLFDVD